MRERSDTEYDKIKYHSGEINRGRFPIGAIVYFVESNGYRKFVKYGIVEENYATEICIQLLDFRDTRLINGTPIKEFKTPTSWKKLPKGWTYNTKLFDEKFQTLQGMDKVDVKNSQSLLEAYNNGVLVKVQDNDYCRIESEIDGKFGYRIVRRYPRDDWHPCYASVRFDKVYATFEEAQAICDKHDTQLKKQSEMSDLEWSIQLIDDDLEKWARFFGHSEEDKQVCRKRILEIENLENVETRISDGGIQWKYVKNKQWKNIIL